jgi:hypothetical protein
VIDYRAIDAIPYKRDKFARPIWSLFTHPAAKTLTLVWTSCAISPHHTKRSFSHGLFAASDRILVAMGLARNLTKLQEKTKAWELIERRIIWPQSTYTPLIFRKGKVDISSDVLYN